MAIQHILQVIGPIFADALDPCDLHVMLSLPNASVYRAEAANSTGKEHLPAVAALGWDWRQLLPNFADDPQARQ